MGKIYERIDDELAAWLGRQHVFFTSTAPSDGGHVNCSPKGLSAFRVLDPVTVGYLDYLGSGVETIAHLRDNGRIVLMFCAFEGPPKIVRLHGHGEVIQRGEEEFASLLEQFQPVPEGRQHSMRAIVRVHLERISDSCGYGVPLMAYGGDRGQMEAWAGNRLRTHGADALVRYQEDRNL